MMRGRTLGCLLVVVTLLGFLAGPAAAAPRGGLTVELASDGFFGLTERPTVTLTLNNRTADDFYVLRWQMPIDGIHTDVFEVKLDGRPVVYTGRLVKFGTPRAEDYVRVAAGASLSVRVDLAGSYDFSQTGEYSVRYRAFAQDVLQDAAPVKVLGLSELVSNVALMAVERDARTAPFLRDLEKGLFDKAGTTTFVSCTSTRQSQLNSARSSATSISGTAKSYIASHTSSSPGARYTQWFGASTSSRYSTVSSHYTSINSAMANAAVTFDCTCTDSYYAYVYPTQPYRIYLCNAFWAAPATGTDSKAGTLVHEMSHFNVVAGTDDWAYGQSAAASLAKKKPDRAVDNADNHEYFAENTPNIN